MKFKRTMASMVIAMGLVAAACGSSSSKTPSSDAGTASTASTAVSGSSVAPVDSGGSTSPGKVTGGTLVFADVSPVVTFDPAKANFPQAGYLRPVYDPLIRQIDFNKFVPALATSWDLKGTTLTLKLRTDVKFTDGTAFDAAAVKGNLDRGKAAKGPMAQVFNAIDSVTVVDPATVTINLVKPRPSIISDLSGIPGEMLSPKAFDAPGLDRAPVGTGPWMFDPSSSVEGEKAVYTKNPNYWDPSVQLVDKVEIRALADPTALLNALSTGQVEAALVSAAQIVAAEKAGLEMAKSPTLPWGLFIFDRDGVVVPAFKDVRVRQAMAYSIDRKAIVKSILFDRGGQAGGSFFAKPSDAYSDTAENAYGLDVAKAKQLLTDAGYPNGFSFDLPTIAPFQSMAEAVSGSLADIGIKANIVTLPSNLTAAFQTKKYGASVMLMPLGSPYTFFEQVLTPGGPYNPFAPDDPALTKLVQTAATAEGDAAQGAAYSALTTAVSEQGIVITLAQGFRTVAYSPKVIGPRISYTSPPDPRGLGVKEG
ncbi:MAG: ABC transporter substrate-binding protein [Ilumatobacteraceae bacterium]